MKPFGWVDHKLIDFRFKLPNHAHISHPIFADPLSHLTVDSYLPLGLGHRGKAYYHLGTSYYCMEITRVPTSSGSQSQEDCHPIDFRSYPN
jgi:hypothetical protein